MEPLTAHPTDDDLELYSMHRTADQQEEEIEKHLLVCERCRNKLDAIDEQVAVMRAALEGIEKSDIRPGESRQATASDER